MLLKKMLRDMGVNRGQFISIFLMALLGVLIFAGIHAEWYGMETEAQRFYTEQRLPTFWAISATSLTSVNTETFAQIPGVAAVSRRLVGDGAAALPGEPTLRLNIIETDSLSQPLVIEGEDFSAADGIWLDSNFAQAHGLKVGDRLAINGLGLKLNKIVLGTILHPEYIYCAQDETEFLQDSTAFGYAFLPAEALPYELPAAYNQLLIEAAPGADLTALQRNIEAKIPGAFDFLLARDDHPSYAIFASEINQNKAIGNVFPLIFFAIAILTMLTTMTRLIANQRTQIGILMALGFSRNKILLHYISYGLWVGLAGGTAGLILGPLLIPPILFTMQKSLYNLPNWYGVVAPVDILVLLGAIFGCGFSSFLACRRELICAPATALRPRPPQAGRRTFLEKGRLWKKLRFSRQWNLRAILRNKLRSAMTVLGIAGCTALFLCALGLRDTISGVTTWMYEDLHTYDYKVKLAGQDLTKETVSTLTNLPRSQLQWEQQIVVRAGDKEKTTGLTVLDQGDLLRFQGLHQESITLPSQGALLSRKLAAAVGAKPGDTVEWRILGDEVWHTIAIAAIYRAPIGQGLAFAREATPSTFDLGPPTAILTAVDPVSASLADSPRVQRKTDLVESFATKLDSMELIVAVMILAAVILGAVVLYNLGILSFTERIREIATLRVIGFSPEQIRVLLRGQNLWLTMAGVLLGLPLGYGLMGCVLTTLPDSLDLYPVVRTWTLLICIVATFAVSSTMSALLARKAPAIDLISALKAVE